VGALIGLRDVPLTPGRNFGVIATGVLETLFTKMKLAGFGAVAICFPVIAWQLYRFVAPGLYRRERAAFLPFLVAAPALFTLGAALVYYIMLPFVLWFSFSQQAFGASTAVQLLPKISEYLSFVTGLLLAFGFCFQLPVVVTLLGLSGMVSSETLAKGRRYAIVVVVVIAAIVTPPDPISQLMLAVPLVLLYEVSIWCVRLLELRRKKRLKLNRKRILPCEAGRWPRRGRRGPFTLHGSQPVLPARAPSVGGADSSPALQGASLENYSSRPWTWAGGVVASTAVNASRMR
jgi:Tat protein translocase TatC